ncbi:uncharacterized protein DS421_20g705260 [Arachis hypogaea]|nr:uncharacterized protein DS421_20g705260 [Arachis hypogaea]
MTPFAIHSTRPGRLVVCNWLVAIGVISLRQKSLHFLTRTREVQPHPYISKVTPSIIHRNPERKIIPKLQKYIILKL